jgi:hypothetical protein
MSFFHKKLSPNLWVTIMPFGPVTLNILLAQIIFFAQPRGWPSFQALETGSRLKASTEVTLTVELSSWFQSCTVLTKNESL